MYILYMDESGIEDVGFGTSHFVLLGLLIPAERWKLIVAQLEDIKNDFGIRDAEIHTAWMHRRYTEQESITDFESLDYAGRRAAAEEAIRRRAGVLGVRAGRQRIRAYRREVDSIRPYLHLTVTERRTCLRRLAQQLSTFSELRIFAEAISKADFTPGPHNTPYEMAFEQVLSRCQAYLSTRSDLAVVVSDNNSTAAPRLTSLSRKFHRMGTFYRAIPNVVETPLFVDSSLTSMIQMADLCAFGLRRQIENAENELWDILEPLGDTRAGICVGVRHFTGRRECTCRICRAHGRR